MRSLRYALKALKAQPVFCGTTVSTLAFGVGFNALMFSAVHGVFLRPLPFPGDETLIAVEVRDQRLGTNIRATPADFFDWREQATTFSQLGAYTSSDLHVFSGDDASRRSGATVTEGFFETLGSKPVLGRLLEARDFVPGSPGSVVISESFWRREFGAQSSVLESALEVTSRPYRIVGVVPDEVRLDTRAELWVPMAIERSQASRQARFLRVIGRLESAAGRQMAEAEMATIGRRIASEFPNTHSHTDIRISSLRAVLLGDFPGKITTLWGAVASVLLMICANLGLLLLSSSARRRGNFAIRLALGATRRQVAAQLMLETTMMASAGGMLGLFLAALALDAARRLAGNPLLSTQIHLGGATVAFTLVLSLLIGLGLGATAVLRLPRRTLQADLSAGCHSRTGTSSHLLQRTLVVTEVAVTVVLTLCSGLMLRSLHALSQVDTGYDVDSISTVSVLFPPRSYPPGSEKIGNYLRHAVESLQSLPGVEHAASSFLAPLQGTGQGTIRVEGADFGDHGEITLALQAVSSTYFETMGLDIEAGRSFARHERGGVALANDVLAGLLVGEVPTVGRRVKLTSALNPVPQELVLIGTVESERLTNLAEEPAPTLYVPHDVELFPLATLYVRRSESLAAGLALPLREALRQLDPLVAVSAPSSMRTIFSDSLQEESTVTLLLSASAGLALSLATIGVFGIWTLFVRERLREFGIRLSLGAKPGRILREVLARSLKLTTVGVAAGAVLALSATRLLERWLFGVQGSDPGTLFAIIVLVVLASLGAGLLPAWRASRVDAASVLREV